MPVEQRQSHEVSVAGKKRFGNNLNKLVKAAAPPIPNDRSKKNARNGLLLLSTKKSSTGGLLSSKASSSSQHPLPNLNLPHQSNASTHQVLLSAVVGASQADAQTQPDAWGVAADKQVHQNHASLEEHQMAEQQARTEQDEPRPKVYGNKYLEHPPDDGPRYEIEASWDEYGGRGVQTSGKKIALDTTDEQASHMTRLAKERAAQRWQEEEERFVDQRHRATQRLQELDEKAGRPAQGKLWDPNQGGSNDRGTQEEASVEKEPAIQLSSYEDSDRGARNDSSTPRMLFDPKSGSMVEVKNREESALPRKRKTRRAKKRKGKEGGEIAVAAVTPDIKPNGDTLKSRKDSISSEKSDNEKSVKPLSRLPRTLGVLYARNEKGELYCKDECDGDLGYGCHSVPGGRVFNADAYQTLLDENTELFKNQTGIDDGYDAAFGGSTNGNNGLGLQTGFNLEELPQPLEWVKADDKLELVTGVDDSPTLKPTAKEWAPSQAALAAAAAAASTLRENAHVETAMDSPEDVVEEDLEEDEVNSGLGFDPMQDIDFMSSPPNLPLPEDAIASVDLKALTLEPSAYSSADTTAKNNIFTFGSTTWGSSGAIDQGTLGWGSSAGGEAGALFGTDVFRPADDNPSGFLAISSSHSWGSAALPGLGNLSTNPEARSADG